MRPALGAIVLASFVLTGCCSTCGNCPFSSWCCGKSSCSTTPPSTQHSASKATPAAAASVAGATKTTAPAATGPYDGVQPASYNSAPTQNSQTNQSLLKTTSYNTPPGAALPAPVSSGVKPTNYTGPATSNPMLPQGNPAMTVPPPPPGTSAMMLEKSLPSAADIAARRPYEAEGWNTSPANEPNSPEVVNSRTADYGQPIPRTSGVPTRTIGVTDTLPRATHTAVGP